MTSMQQEIYSNKKLPVAEVMLLLVAVFWGTSYGLTKEALVYISVIGFLSIRFILTFLLLAPLLIKDCCKGEARDWFMALPTGGILLAIFVCETYGVANTSAANAAILISLCVLITPFIEWIVFREYPGNHVFLLAGGCLFGVLMLTYKMDSGLQINSGDLYILMAAFLRACMVIATKQLMKGRRLSSISLTAIQSGVVGSGTLVIFIALGSGSSIQLPIESDFWLITLYLVLFCTIFAFFAQNYGVRRTSPSRAALLMGTEPAFGAIFAVIWLGEQLSWVQVFGGALIVVCAISGSAVSVRE